MSDVPTVIQEIAKEIGATAEKAWPLYIEYIWADALVASAVAGAIALVAILGYAAAFCLASRIGESDGVIAVRLGGLLILMLVLLITSLEGTRKIATVIAPEGAAINLVLKRVTQ